MYQILTRSKDLNNPVLGSKLLNKLGLHLFRVNLAERCTRQRRRFNHNSASNWQTNLVRDGAVAIKNFLPDDVFQAVKGEAETAAVDASHDVPIQQRQGKGFGPKQYHDWGFDRCDGGTLNRFIDIEPARHPEAYKFSHLPVLSDLTLATGGRRQKSNHMWFYQTIHGDEKNSTDQQKIFHRDTFFRSIKFWFFVHPVTSNEGPFCYVPGSHHLTPERRAWEKKKVLEALEKPKGKRSSSFRIADTEIKALGLKAPHLFTVPENTLVMADTFGFHCRGAALAGAERLAIYGNMRPWPFGLWGS